MHLSDEPFSFVFFIISLIRSHPHLPFPFRHLFDGIAEHGARHLMSMLMEEIAKQVHRDALAHLAEHPTYGLVHQIVGMVKVDLGISQTPRRVSLL